MFRFSNSQPRRPSHRQKTWNEKHVLGLESLEGRLLLTGTSTAVLLATHQVDAPVALVASAIPGQSVSDSAMSSLAGPAAMSGVTVSTSAASVPAPTNVKATFLTSANQMQVTWNASAGATSYNVYRNTVNNSNSATLIGPSVSGLSYLDKSPTPDASYYYWVKAGKGSTMSAFSTAAQCNDSDHAYSGTKTFNLNPLLNVINFTKDLADDINGILKWDTAPKPSVSGKLDTWSACMTENVVETPSNQVVSGTSVVTASESGEVTGQYGGGISAFNIASFAIGITLHESCKLVLSESYSATSHAWVVIPSGSSITGSVSANCFGTVAILGHTGELDLTIPSVSFASTITGNVTITPHVSVNVTYQLSGGAVHEIYQSPTLALPSWTFNVGTIVIP